MKSNLQNRRELNIFSESIDCPDPIDSPFQILRLPRKTFLAALCGALLPLLSSPTFATTIRYEAIDLADTGSGDLWQYHYQVSDHIFQADDGYSILFATDLYKDLEDPPLSPNSDWDVISLEPDPLLPNPGRYDSLAVVNVASLADLFTINFIWLGLGQQPGSQPFEIYRFDGTGNVTDIIETGRTIPLQASAPEPGMLALLASGWLGLALQRRRKKPSPAKGDE